MEDPLAGHSRLGFLRLTIGDLKGFSIPDCQDDMDSTHTYLKSIELSHPEKIKDLAMAAVDRGVELPNINDPSYVASGNNIEAEILSSDIPNAVALGDLNEAEIAKDKNFFQHRRPGLAHRQNDYIFKPISKRPPDFIMPTLDLSKVTDPHEYFLAHRKFQNAKKEVERITGRPMDLGEKKKSIFTERRPVISGRQATYKEPKPVMKASNTSHVDSCKENFEPERPILEVVSLEKEIVESRPRKNQKVSEGFNELEFMNSDPLENDAAANLLEEFFPTKHMDLGKISLPTFRGFQSSVVGETVPKRRVSLADAQSIIEKYIDLGKNSVLQDPPTPENCSFSFVNSLNKPVLSSKISVDPCRTLDIDPFPAKKFSDIKGIHNKSDHGVAVKQSSVSAELKPHLGEEYSLSAEASTDYATHKIENNLLRNVLNNSNGMITALNINHTAAEKLSSIEGNHGQSDRAIAASKLGDFGKLTSPVLEEGAVSDATIDFKGASTADCTVNDENYMDGNGSNAAVTGIPTTARKFCDQSDNVDYRKGLSKSTKSKSFTFKNDCIGATVMDSHEIWIEDSIRVLKNVDGTLNSPCINDPKDGFKIGNMMGLSVDIHSNNSELYSNVVQSNEHARWSEEKSSIEPANDAEYVQNGALEAARFDSKIEEHIVEKSKCIHSPLSQPSPSKNPIPVDDIQTEGQNIDEEQLPMERLVEKSKVKKSSRKRKEPSGRKKLEATGSRRSARIGSNCLEGQPSPSINPIPVDDIQTESQNIDEEPFVKQLPTEKLVEKSKVKKSLHKREPPGRKKLEAAGSRRSARIGSKCLEGEEFLNRHVHESTNPCDQSNNVDTRKGSCESGKSKPLTVDDDDNGAWKMDSRDHLTRDDFEVANLLTQLSSEPVEGVPDNTSKGAKSNLVSEEHLVEEPNTLGEPGLAKQFIPVDDDTQSKAHKNDEEQFIKEVLPETAIERRKSKAGGRRSEHLRKSLAGAGTLWQSGVRRSTRIKSRPLRYWKGERFLYGRIHETLETVIGVKYISPGKDGPKNSNFTVKSYVSDDYKDLVEMAALH